MGEWSPFNIGSPSEADAGIGPLLGWNDLPLDPSSQATSYFIHSVIMSGDTEMLGVAITSYALFLTSVSSEEAGACQGFRIYRRMVLGHGRLHCTIQKVPLEFCDMAALL